MSNTIGLKIVSNSVNAKSIKIVRKYSPLSISEIKNLIIDNKYLFCCDYTDDIQLPIIINCYNELSASNIPVKLYEHTRECDISFLNNLCTLYNEISQQIDEEMDKD